MVLEDRLHRAELLTDAKDREYQMLEEELATKNLTHLQEKEQLEQRIQMLEDEISQHVLERTKPWYQAPMFNSHARGRSSQSSKTRTWR